MLIFEGFFLLLLNYLTRMSILLLVALQISLLLDVVVVVVGIEGLQITL
jgi:hypothetical protein